MEAFISNIENYFNEDCQTVLDKAIEMQLSPQAIIEIWYYYCLFINNTPLSRDNIMCHIADMRFGDITSSLQDIKNEISVYLSS